MKLKFLAAFLGLFTLTFGQTVLVPFTGSTTTTDCSGTFQDHAGNSNYSNYASGYLGYFIHKNIERRKNAASKLKKSLYKLASNALFGKMLFSPPLHYPLFSCC